MQQTRVNPWIVLLVLCLGFFMNLLDTTIVNVAIPTITDALNAPIDEILWVLNAYILAFAVLQITAGRLGDLFGQRLLFILGLVIFTAASATCGISQNIEQLIAARVVQGVGGAMLAPQTLAMLTMIFPPERRGAAFGVWGAVVGIAAVAGPTLGGLIVTDLTWRDIFFLNVPIGIATIVAAIFLVPDVRAGKAHNLDLGGLLLATVGLLAIVYGLIEGQRYNWGNVVGFVSIPLIMGVGVALLVAFAFWERVQREPLIPPILIRNRNFVLMNWVGAAVAFGMLGMFLPFVIYLQAILGMSALAAGLTLSPMSLVPLFVAPIAGRLADARGGKYVLIVGLVIFSIGMALVVYAATATATWVSFVVPLLVCGLGMGAVFAPLTTVAMRNIAPPEAGAASGVLSTTRQLGSVIGTAVIGAVLQNQIASSLRSEAIARSGGLPEAFRQQLINAVTSLSNGGIELGATSANAGPGSLPPGIPPQVAQQVEQLFHDIFVAGYIDALRPTLGVTVVVLVVAALSCLFIQRRAAIAEAERRREAELIAV